MEAVADRAFQHPVWGGVQVDAILGAQVHAALPSVGHDFHQVRVQQDLAPVGEFDLGESAGKRSRPQAGCCGGGGAAHDP